ncbi:MAG: cyclic nucleotide-binding domain-containing protein [Caldilineae bacterium]|nr:MAG: cyclic nucleotide-binding domain-containing protein [Caldilineae bacterium]
MSIIGILRDVDILLDLSEAQLEKIASIGETKTYNGAEIVFKENTTSNELYIILNGTVEIVVDPATVGSSHDASTGVVTIATLRRGESFGEVALVDQGLRSASAMAAQDRTELLVIPQDKFNQLCQQDFELGYIVMRNIAADLAFKLRQTDIMIQEQILWGRKEKK